MCPLLPVIRDVIPTSGSEDMLMAGYVHQDNSVSILGREMKLRALGGVLEGLCSPGSGDHWALG